MNDSDFEEAFAKALLNGEIDLIPADQIGANPGDFGLSEEKWADTVYSMYYDSCHAPNPLESSWTNEKYCPVENLAPNRFACFGQKGHFQWAAMSVYYDPSLHKMTPQMEAYNRHHKSAVCGGGFGPCENLAQAINEVDDTVYLMRNPLLGKTSNVEGVDDLRLIFMEGFMGKFLGTGCSVQIFKKLNGTYVADSSKVRDKDIVLPFIYATNKTLQIYANLANAAIKAGANTVTGIFATRIKPTIDGRECKSIPREMEVHEFTPRMSFRF